MHHLIFPILTTETSCPDPNLGTRRRKVDTPEPFRGDTNTRSQRSTHFTPRVSRIRFPSGTTTSLDYDQDGHRVTDDDPNHTEPSERPGRHGDSVHMRDPLRAPVGVDTQGLGPPTQREGVPKRDVDLFTSVVFRPRRLSVPNISQGEGWRVTVASQGVPVDGRLKPHLNRAKRRVCRSSDIGSRSSFGTTRRWADWWTFVLPSSRPLSASGLGYLYG